MPVAYSEEFRRRAVELAQQGEKSIAKIAAGIGVSEPCLDRWVKVAAVDSGVVPGFTSDVREEPVRLRRENRVQAAEIEILKQASAYFAMDVLNPKAGSRR